MRAGPARRPGIEHFADADAGGFQRGALGAALGLDDGGPGLLPRGGREARVHASQRVGKIGQPPVAVRDRMGRVLPGAPAPDERRHQDGPDRACQEEQRVPEAFHQRRRGQLGGHDEAGRQQGAHDGGGRSQHAEQPAERAADKRKGQQQPEMRRAGAGQQAEQGADQAQRQHRSRALAQGAAGVAEAGPERRDGGPAQPGFVHQHGKDDGGRADGGGLQGVEPQHIAQGSAPTGKQTSHAERGNTAEMERGPGPKTATLPCRQDTVRRVLKRARHAA